MVLQPGSRFGVFDVQSSIGSGGMGEVFLAIDTRLGRPVALKVLRAPLTADADHLDRFAREARALAALNHSGIAAIYDTIEIDRVPALVLEYVEGETLEQRLRGGPLPIREALAIARAMAESLDAAHERGLVHRDVKPGNVKITPTGDVKLLDFGIARMLVKGDATEAATVAATEPGVVIGTSAYMSPEQARGHAVDKRADVWAFGCVLYEMLTGRAAFGGATRSDSLARTLTSEPDWKALPKQTPAGVVRVLQRCLDKDPKLRLRGLAGIDLAFESGTTPAAAPRSSLAAFGLATIVLAAVAVASVLRADPPAADTVPVRFEIAPSVRMAESGSFALSPDGRHLAFIGSSVDGRFQLWERSLGSIEIRPIHGTEGEIAGNTTLFWSPDSRAIGFYANGAVKRIDHAGGQVQIVCKLSTVGIGGAWNSHGDIVVGDAGGGLVRCPDTGGDPTPITIADSSPGGAVPRILHIFPTFLPGGRRLLYLRVSRGMSTGSGLYVADLDVAAEQQSDSRLLDTGFAAKYAVSAAAAGRILFVRNGALWAVPFDHERLAITGEAEEVAPRVGTFRDGAFFDTNGPTLVYRGGVPDHRLAWRNRRGDDLGQAGDAGQYTGLALSPDGSRAAVARENSQNRSEQDLWIVDLQRNATTRFTSDPMPKSIPSWLPDGRALLYSVGHDSADIRLKPLAGGGERTILRGGDLKGVAVNPLLTTMSVSADGELLVFNLDTRGPSQSDIWMLPLRNPADAAPLIQQDFDQMEAALSPDRRWLAYVSNETGASEVYVRSLQFTRDRLVPATGSPVPVSRGGGRAPRWRADSRELFFQSATGAIMAAAATPASVGEPLRLFDAPGALPHWGPTAKGDRFLLALPAGVQQLPFTVILNWMSGTR